MIKTTHLVRGVAAVLLTASTASAFPATSWERAELFATCFGRLSALAAHQSANHLTGHVETQNLRDTFEVLLEAAMPQAQADGVPASHARRWRAQGWADLAVLLADTQYAFDQSRADRAQARMEADVATCRGMVLGTS